jgi:hypothetical protein
LVRQLLVLVVLIMLVVLLMLVVLIMLLIMLLLLMAPVMMPVLLRHPPSLDLEEAWILVAIHWWKLGC